MRVAVIGATGNAGTAVLRILGQTPDISEIIGVARRLPDTESEPYRGCRWASVDIAAASHADSVVTELTELFRGVDAVIHLAWLIQPNRQRELLRRVNVEGTRRVAEAVAAAGVPHLVVASSVGVYSPDTEREERRGEGWPNGGIDSSHYSVDKAAQEKVLDEFCADHPDVVVTRIRPGLMFQAAAGSEIQRYFLGEKAPVQLLRKGRPPVLPLPKGIRVQAAHSEDVARAYVAAVLRKAPGAFNVCAHDILGPRELADIIDHGRFVELPPALFRMGLMAGYRTRLVPTDPGWIDMAMKVPLMDNSRAISELGWEPRHTAAEALTELIEAMVEGDGADSPPMVSRKQNEATVPGVEEPAGTDVAGKISEKFTRDLLDLYLSDHLTGSTAGANRLERMARDYVDTPRFAELSRLAAEVRAERTFLRNLIDDLGVRRRRHRQAAAWVGERVARLKTDGRVVKRSPMTLLLETELMRSAVHGKIGGWQTLQANAELLGMDPKIFADLFAASERQISTLDEIHRYARTRALRDDRKTFWS